MKVTFLGTNGWYDTDQGATLCVLVESDTAVIVLDAGSGLFKMEKNMAGGRPVYLFLSHFHMDHICGLHGLSKLNIPAGMTILGQTGTGDILNHIVARPFTVPIERLPFPVSVIELGEQESTLPFQVNYLPMDHSDPCYGYRITIENRTITFCTDTGYCKNAVKLAQDADLLITECAFLPGENNTDWPHINPETAARIALESKVKQLVMTHFDASRYINREQRINSQMIAQQVFKNTISSFDGMTIEI